MIELVGRGAIAKNFTPPTKLVYLIRFTSRSSLLPHPGFKFANTGQQFPRVINFSLGQIQNGEIV
jgi:hypothetical protein